VTFRRRRFASGSAQPGNPHRPSREASRVSQVREQAGKFYEAEIAAACIAYKRKGEMQASKTNPPVRGPNGCMFFSGSADVDYAGTIGRAPYRGISIYFDVKGVSGKSSYAHAPEQRHQLEFLQDRRAVGAVCFLWLRCRTSNLAWLLFDFEPLLVRRPGPAPSVAIRAASRVGVKKGDASVVTHHLPHVVPYTLAEQSALGRPEWDFLALALREHARRTGDVR
jgi:penicillin-binding protein-related factor A (putative recombinase)